MTFGNILYDREDVKARWYEYCKSLFAEDPEKRDRVEWDKFMIEEEPMVMHCEIRTAIQRMKNG